MEREATATAVAVEAAEGEVGVGRSWRAWLFGDGSENVLNIRQHLLVCD